MEEAVEYKVATEAVLTNDDGIVKVIQHQEEKAVQAAEIVGSFVPFGVSTFEDLEAAQQAKVTAQRAETLSEQFRSIVGNIMANPDIEDKAAAVTTQAAEFSTRINAAMAQKEKWQPLTDKVATKVDEVKQRPMKTEGGVKFPASDFAFVPSPDKPSTWKLRLAEDRPGNVTIRQLGRAAAAFSPGGFRGRKVQIPSNKIAGVKSKIRAAYRKLKVKPGDMPASIKERPFTVWKEADGSYRWLAVYSNNYRDDDDPAEIISADAHKDFVKAVDGGEWPHPELLFWHVPGTRLGITDLVAYDGDTGFSLASGTIDKERESIVDIIAQREDLLVSHGMPVVEIQREDTDDSTIITRYRSKEISLLPDWAAANKHTKFVHLTKEGENMAIPKHKKEELEALGFDVDELEAQLTTASEQANEEGRESKELEPEETKAEVKAEPAEVEVVAVVETPTVPDVAQIIADTINDALAPLVARLSVLEEAGKEKAIEAPPATPLDTFTSILRSRVIGASAAAVDGRTKEARDGPVETIPDAPKIVNSGNPLADSVISRIVSGSTYKELQEIRDQQEERLRIN